MKFIICFVSIYFAFANTGNNLSGSSNLDQKYKLIIKNLKYLSCMVESEKKILPLSQIAKIDNLIIDSLEYRQEKNCSLKDHNIAIETLDLFFNSESQIIPFILGYDEKNNEIPNLGGLYERHLVPKPSSPYSSTLSARIPHAMLMGEARYTILTIGINYCLNQVFTPKDIRLIFFTDFMIRHKEISEYLEKQYSKFKMIYNEYYITDRSKFYLEIVKEFGMYIEPYKTYSATYTIKEPYKSMNDPDLIKIQEYFNEK